jgi:ATP-dependent Lon protease
MKKINSLRYMEHGSGEYYKVNKWVDAFMQIPFGVCSELPVAVGRSTDAEIHDFMDNARDILNKVVYGLNDAKLQIMQIVGQWVRNPESVGNAIAIHGPMGTGKTTLVKEGVSEILKRPTVVSSKAIPTPMKGAHGEK